MDAVARAGRVGLVKTIPDGLSPGSDVANMSLMGYDPAAYYSGRAPIEAASMGIKLKNTDVAFRCNLVTLKCGLMVDYSAGHIETADAHEIIAALQKELGSPTVTFYPGVSYRHITVMADFPAGKLDCTPPHDISGKEYAPTFPQARARILCELSWRRRDRFLLLVLSTSDARRRGNPRLPTSGSGGREKRLCCQA